MASHPRSRLLATLALLLAAPLAQERMSPELLWKLARVSDPQISPDGSHVLYNVRRYDLAANSGNGQVFVLDLRSGRARQLTSGGSNSQARWSPDGGSVAFVSTRGGSPQIWVMAIDGGEARQVTAHDGGVTNMAWSPTGKHFSFTAEVKLDPDVHDLFPDLPQAEAAIYDDLMVRHWDSWKDGRYSHLFVVDAAGGEAIDLMAGMRVDTPLRPFGGGEQIAWSPDGKELCYTAKVVSEPEASTDSSLFTVAIDAPAQHKEIVGDGMPGYDMEPRYAPDGKSIAFLSMERGGFESDKSRLMLLERGSGALRELTAGFDGSAHEPTWLADGSGLLFSCDVRGTTQLFRVGRDGGAPAALTSGRWQFAAPTPTPDGRSVLCLRQHTERPFELVRVDAARVGPGEALTDVNGALYANLQLPEVEERWTEATDGARIHSWVIKPPGFDPAKKYPMLLYCQGGPQSQVGQWFSFRWNFHLMAAQGYVVLAVNRRGLPGFGQAWNDEISRDWGGQAMRDLLSACDDLRAQPYVDRERVAAVGASFGGYTVYWLMGNGGDRFCSMVAHCGVFNLESMYLSTEELFFVNWDLGGPWWLDSDVKRDYERFSPHRFVRNWKTPLLVIHGNRDYRVPLEQGLSAFTAAQLQGVPSRLLYFPAESHWVLSPQNGVVWHRVFFDWLARTCKPEKTSRAAPAAAPARGPGAAQTRVAAAAQEPNASRDNVIERVDDTQVLQLFADGFEQLDLNDKLLCYHLSNAAIAGRDIFLDQKFAHNLAIRDLLEGLYVHRTALPADVSREVERYTKLFWLHNGIHHAYTTEKQLLRLSAQQLRAAVRLARADGAVLADDGEIARLFEVMTDPDSYRSVTDKSPAGGGDPLLSSCNNLYVGVAMADLEGFTEHNGLNSRLVKRDGELVEEVYRMGDGDKVPPGHYAAQLAEVVRHLELAMPHAPPKTRAALEKLVRFYRTGDLDDWRAFNIAWVQDTDSVVDQINGFVEVYLDARGQKGSWEAVVSFQDKAKTAAIAALAQKAQWFEDRMPWSAEFKKADVRGISARAIAVICETGDSGPVTPIGINLPNEADIRQQYGSKSVNLSNVVAGYNMAQKGAGAVSEFAWDQAEIDRAKAWGDLTDDIHTNLHEVVGHASGRVRDEVANPAQRLGVYYSTLEEGRADLVALYWIGDPRVVEMGMAPSLDAALAQYEYYSRNALVQLRRVPLGKKVEEDHMRNRQMIVHWLLANAPEAVRAEQRGGSTYYRVLDREAYRQGCGRLLAEVMRIKATGDFRAGKDLVETYGTKVDRALHEQVLARLARLDLPALSGFVQPELRLVRDAAGNVADVTVHYPMDLAEQMLRWSGHGAHR